MSIVQFESICKQQTYDTQKITFVLHRKHAPQRFIRAPILYSPKFRSRVYCSLSFGLWLFCGHFLSITKGQFQRHVREILNSKQRITYFILVKLFKDLWLLDFFYPFYFSVTNGPISANLP